jgi:hypothetical protein
MWDQISRHTNTNTAVTGLCPRAVGKGIFYINVVPLLIHHLQCQIQLLVAGIHEARGETVGSL